LSFGTRSRATCLRAALSVPSSFDVFYQMQQSNETFDYAAMHLVIVLMRGVMEMPWVCFYQYLHRVAAAAAYTPVMILSELLESVDSPDPKSSARSDPAQYIIFYVK
jgi:hypothetical protein